MDRIPWGSPRSLVKAMRERLRRVWVSVKWPVPLWRLRGYAELPVGSERFRFYGIKRPHYVWALLARKGMYEPEVIGLLERELRPGDTFLDVGAHMGSFSLLASRLVGHQGQVLALEPDPQSVELFRLNRRGNRVRDGLVWLDVIAASDRDELGHLSGRRGDGISALSDEGTEVECRTLDSLLPDRELEPDVVKIDVEGAEGAVLRGGRETLRRARCIVVELHADKMREMGEDPEAVLDGFRELGEVEELGSRHAGNRNVVVRPNGSA
jgi:FkbM family methyltransferase